MKHITNSKVDYKWNI